MDTDGDGAITLDEFTELLHSYQMEPNDIFNLFVEIDTVHDDSGIMIEELIHAEIDNRRRAELKSILKKEQRKQNEKKKSNKGERRLDDFDEDQLNDGMH